MEDSEIAIIGCGASGLSTAKFALKLKLNPTVFERSHSVGGLWRTDDGFVWKSLQTNVTKYNTSFSDFHWDNSSPLFPSAQQVQDYFSRYAGHHNLIPYIKFGCEVTNISHNPDNYWEVTWKCNSLQQEKKKFKYVVVCSGFFSSPIIPQLDLNGFKGQVIHSSEYRSPELFHGKRVLVVGTSFSGLDISAEIAKVATKTHISIKRPVYILPRYATTKDYKNIPIDLLVYYHKSDSSIPLTDVEKYKNKHNFLKSVGRTLEMDDLTIDTNNPPLVAISDSFFDMLDKGKIVICKAFQKFEGNKIIFEDGNSTEVDVVIFATGYRLNFSFFDKDFKETVGYESTDHLQPLLLHETIFPPKYSNIAFVGIYRGPYIVINELQALWACLVFSGQLVPPSESEINQGIQHQLNLRNMIKRPQFLVEYVEVADLLAKVVGVFPKDKIDYLMSTPLISAHYGLVSLFQEKEKEKEAMNVIEEVTKLVAGCKNVNLI